MKLSIVSVAGATALAVIAWAALAQNAPKPQIQAAPSYIPIGVAASGGSSTAWFHNPSTGTVLACQSSAVGGASISAIQCVTSRLP